MSTLRKYLVQKREALLARRERAKTATEPAVLRATVRAAGRSGVREIRIRDFQVISDAAPDFAGYDLGPGSPELQLGVLGSCVTHTFLIHAADRQIPLDALSVEVTGQMDPRVGQAGYEHLPVYPRNIRYTVHLTSPASTDEVAALHAAVGRTCPIYNLLRNLQEIIGTVEHTRTPELAPVGA